MEICSIHGHYDKTTNEIRCARHNYDKLEH